MSKVSEKVEKGFDLKEEPKKVYTEKEREEFIAERKKLTKELQADNVKTYEEKVKILKNFNKEHGLECFTYSNFGRMNMWQEDGIVKGCELCNFTGGYLVDMENDYEGWHECECKKYYDRKKRIKKADIPVIYKNVRMADIKDIYTKDHDKYTKVMTGLNKMLEDTDKWVKEGLGVGIYGDVKGSGKSMLLCAFCNELLEKDYEVKFVNQIELLDRIKASWEREKGEEKESQIFDILKNVDILAIDELGFNDNKSWLNDKMYSIINNRYENKKPIIYTSNKCIKEMQFDERIVSRLQQMVNEVEWVEQDVRGMDAITNKIDFFN